MTLRDFGNTAGDVAEATGLEVKSILRWVRLGETPCYRNGNGTILFTREQVTALVEFRTRQEPTPGQLRKAAAGHGAIGAALLAGEKPPARRRRPARPPRAQAATA